MRAVGSNFVPPGQLDRMGTTRPGGPPGHNRLSQNATAESTPAVNVDMPWKEDADAAIAEVEAKQGAMSDRMKERVYADFAGRAAGLGDHAEKGLTLAEAWANVNAAIAANEADTDTDVDGPDAPEAEDAPGSGTISAPTADGTLTDPTVTLSAAGSDLLANTASNQTQSLDATLIQSLA